MLFVFEIVSKVFPDLDIMIFKKLLFFSFFNNGNKLSKKKIFFFICEFRKLYIAFVPRIDPPIPINLIEENLFLNLFKNLFEYEYL